MSIWSRQRRTSPVRISLRLPPLSPLEVLRPQTPTASPRIKQHRTDLDNCLMRMALRSRRAALPRLHLSTRSSSLMITLAPTPWLGVRPREGCESETETVELCKVWVQLAAGRCRCSSHTKHQASHAYMATTVSPYTETQIK